MYNEHINTNSIINIFINILFAFYRLGKLEIIPYNLSSKEPFILLSLTFIVSILLLIPCKFFSVILYV